MSRLSEPASTKQLKDQLAEKEFRIGELENRVRDLFNEAKELDEKLRVANRNARVLEEENSNYHVLIKSVDKDGDLADIAPLQKEAVKLIRENEELCQALADAEEQVKVISSRNRDTDQSTDKQVRELRGECERMRKERVRELRELENTRRQCVDLQRRLDDDEETLKTSKELWAQERERYQQRIDELLDFNTRTGRPHVARASKPRNGGAEEPLEQLFLKEEVAQLEAKLKEAQEKSWAKEKEWVRTEAELQRRIGELRAAGGAESRNDKALFQAMKEQVRALQNEIEALRNDRRLSRAAQGAPSSAASSRGASVPALVTPAAVSAEWANRYDSMAKENDHLRDQADAAKAKILELQNAVDEKVLACKELEVQLAAMRKQAASSASHALLANRASSIRSTSERSYVSRATDATRTQSDGHVIITLRQRVRELEAKLNKLGSQHEEEEAVSHARIKEYEKQIEELLRESAELRDESRAAAEQANAENAAHDCPDGVMRLTKDKRESVEEVMRLLEFAWEGDDEAKRQLRRAKYQGAALANQDAAKDDEMHRLHKVVNELQGKLRELEKQANDNDNLKEAVTDLRKQNRGIGSENDKLRRKIGELEKGRSDAARELSAKRDDARRRAEELQTENDGLRRRLASARKAASQPVSPRLSARSPQPSARQRTPEVAVLSQLSVRSTEEQRRSAVPEGAHLAFTVVELTEVLRNGRPITEPGHVIIKLKSIKEKYKTSVKELSSVVRFDENFTFYLAQPDQDVITLHVFYKVHGGSREYHIGDACFSMATLYRGVPRQRIAPVVQNPGTREARRAARIEVHLQTDDFGKTMAPTREEVEEEKVRFKELMNKLESSAPENLHAVDVYLASRELQ